MLQKFLLAFIATVFSFAVSGQTKNVSGQVKDEKGEGVTNASINESGNSKNSVKADVNGFFVIKIKEGALLVITAIGFETKTVSPGNITGLQNFTLVTKEESLKEVVVTTGQGIKKRPKEIGFANATVQAAEITNGKSPQLAQALSGKVSGLTITNANNSISPAVKINLRGFRSMTGNNDALIVLDGVPVPQNTIALLNPNDIADVTILKGGQAATIYGSDGVNGAILINTRSGTKGKPIIQFNTSLNFEQLSFLPKFQEEFGSGSDYGGLNSAENYRTFENQQYGDRYDGTIRPLGRILEDGSVFEAPYASIPNIRRKIWNIGYTNTNDISISGGDPTSKFFASFQDAVTKGIVPKDEARRTQARFSATKEFGKFSVTFRANYIQEKIDAERASGTFYNNVLNTSSHVPLNDLKDWQNNKFANPNGYYNDFFQNPWFTLDQERQSNNNNFFNGNLELNLKATSWLSITERVGIAVSNLFSKDHTKQFLFSDYAAHDAQVPAPWPNDYDGIPRAQGDRLGSVADFASYGRRINNDIFLTANKDFGDFSTKLIVGQNIQVRKSKNLNVNSNSIVIPDLFNVANRTGELGGGEANSEQRKYGYFADATIGYKDYVFLHGSGRLDGTSLFYLSGRPQNSYQYAYYGGDISLILSDIFPSLKNDFLNFAKIRLSANKNGNDNLAPYQLALTYNLGPNFPYGNVAGTTVGNIFPDNNLKPEFVTSYEAGAEFAFWKNRINLDVAIFKQISEDQVLTVSLTPSTGFPAALINIGRSDSWGYEADAKANVIKTKKLNWDVSVRYSYNTNEVKSLYGDLQRLAPFINSGNIAQTTVEIGQSFPYLRATAYQRDQEGRVVINPANGYPLRDANLKGFGNSFPKHQLGIGTTLKYRDITFSANAEYRGGYSIYHGLGSTMAFTGSAAVTASHNRQAFVFPNSSYFDGTKYVENTSIATQNGHYTVWVDHYRLIAENFVTSGAFWKLRDVSLTYNLPAKLISKVKIFKAATIGVFGRNLVTLLPKENLFTDPEFSVTVGNGLGINTVGINPPVRNFGANLSITF